MNTAHNIHFDALDINRPTTEIIDSLLNDYYPGFFDLLSEISNQLGEIERFTDVSVLKTLLMKVTGELDAMYRKEKLVLFPYLLKLESQKERINCCTTFSNVKQHYNSILNVLQEARKIFKVLFPEVESNSPLQEIKHNFRVFEVGMIRLYTKKEQFLFNKFKDCVRSN